jgi:hypothetical protein
MYKKILESRQMGKQTFNQTKKILSILLVVLFVAALTAPIISADAPHHSSSGLQTFNTEQLAKQHCPTDTVVWLNLQTGIYHYKGQHWYGNTKSGAYVCQKEADQAGNRATKGQ